jgi:RNA polymerase sigma factor (sigma-70 family)
MTSVLTAVGNGAIPHTPYRREMQEPVRELKHPMPLRPDPPAAENAAAGFEEVYLLFAPRLRKIAVRKFGIPYADAETLVHDVFATYLMHASSVHALEPYLIGAICNASRHYLRRSDAAEAIFCGEIPCAATPDDALLKEIERKLLLSRLLARIGFRCRDLLRRYYMNGETTRAIADGMQSTPGTILVFLHKCRRRALAAYRSMTARH